MVVRRPPWSGKDQVTRNTFPEQTPTLLLHPSRPHFLLPTTPIMLQYYKPTKGLTNVLIGQSTRTIVFPGSPPAGIQALSPWANGPHYMPCRPLCSSLVIVVYFHKVMQAAFEELLYFSPLGRQRRWLYSRLSSCSPNPKKCHIF